MKPILHTMPSSGSPRGLHYWLGWLGCPRRAWYQEQRDKNEPQAFEKTLAIGSIFHAYCEIYYKTILGKGKEGGFKFDTNYVKFSQVEDCVDGTMEEARATAERMFRYYRVASPPDDFGKIVAVEQAIKAPEGLFPVEVTGRIDLVVKFTKASALKFNHRWNCDVQEGVYIVDHKTRGSYGPSTSDADALSLQFPCYALIWNALNREKVQGVIVNTVGKDKNVHITRSTVPLMLDAQEKVIRDALYWANKRREEAYGNIPPMANVVHCMDYYRACPFWTEGLCNRRN
jgi:hypothetical protein